MSALALIVPHSKGLPTLWWAFWWCILLVLFVVVWWTWFYRGSKVEHRMRNHLRRLLQDQPQIELPEQPPKQEEDEY